MIEQGSEVLSIDLYPVPHPLTDLLTAGFGPGTR